MAEEHKEQVASVHEGDGEGEVKDRGLFDFLGKKSAEENKPEEDYLSAGVQNFHIEEGYKLQDCKEKEEEKPHGFFDKEEEKKPHGFFEKEEVKPYGVFEKEKEKEEEVKHHGLLDKLHRSHSSSSSSSSSDKDELEADGETIKKKKKKQVLKEKIQGKEEHHDEENKKPPFVSVPPVEEPVVVVEELELQEAPIVVPEESKKGFLEKIKDKLPGHSKKPTEEGAAAPPVVHPPVVHPPVVHEAAEVTEGKEKKGFLEKIIEKLPGHHKSTGEEGDKTPASH